MKDSIPLPSFLPARFVACLALAAVFALAPSSVFAASQTWDGSDSNDWSTGANWVGNAVPGSTSVTNSADVATFNADVANNQIVIDANRNISGLTFNGSSGNYTIGTTAGNALRMTASGTILIGNGLTTNNTTITINAPLLMYGGLTINNQAPNATNKFVIGGDISAANTGVKTISLQSVSASSTNMNEITGLISNGNATATVAVSQSTSGGNWRLLNDANSFTGNLTVQGGSVWVSSIGDQGVASAAGAGTTINIGGSTSTGSLYFIGTGQTTNRTINLAGTTGGANIYANNASGLLKFTSNFTASGAGNKTLTLRGTGSGEVSGAIVNSAAGSTGVTAQANTGNTTIALASTDGLTIGATVTAAGIPATATISNISGNTITLNQSLTSNVTTSMVVTNAAIRNNTSVTKIEAGTWTLSGNNTYTGATTVTAGILNIRNDSALGTTVGGTTVANGATLQLQGGISVGNETLTINGLGVAGQNGVLVNVSGTNSYGGQLTMGSEVTTAISSDGSGTLNLTNTGTITNANIRTLLLTGSGNGSLAGVLAAGSITKNGTGTWTLSSNNTYTGTTTVNSGILNIRNDSALGTTAGITSVASGATLQLEGGITVGNEALTINGLGAAGQNGALVNVSGTNSYGGQLTIGSNAGGTAISSDSGTLNLTNTGAITNSNNRTLFLTGSGNGSLAGALASSGAITKNGTGTWTLSGSNTYTGTTTINAGNLTLTGGSAIVDTGTVTLANTAGAILHVAQSETIRSLSGGGAIGGNVSIAGGQSLGITATSTFNGSITGAGGLVRSGASATLTLNGSSDYTGGTTINLGTISARANNALGNGALTINASGSNTFLNLNGTNQTFTSLTVLGANASVIQNEGNSSVSTVTFDIGDGVTSSSTSMFYFRNTSNSSIYSGTLGLVKTGNGTLDFSVLNAANTAYSGGLTVNGGTFSYNSTATTAALGSGAITLGGGTLNYTGSSSVTIANNATLTVGSTSTLNNAAGTVTVSGTISGTGNLTKSGAGTLTLSAANAYSGDTLVSAGTLTLSNALALQNSTIDTSGAGVITLSSVTTPTFGGLKGSGNLSSVITTGYSSVTGITLNPGSGVSNTYSGVISNGAVNMTLTKTGAGTQVLSGDNTYSGNTTISAGTLQLGHANALGATTSGLVVNGTLDLNGNSITKSTLSGETGNITSLSAATLTFNRTNASIGTYNGTIGGDVALSITNSNTTGTSTVLTLGGSNTYTGNTTIYNSALAITNGAALGNSTVIVQKGGQTEATYGGQIRLSGGITISNNMTLAGNGYGGFNGALRNNSGNNTYTGTITIAASETTTRISSVGGGTLSLNGTISLGAATYGNLFQHAGGDIRLGGNGITGSATSFNVLGGGSNYLITDRANAWAGTTGLTLGATDSIAYGRVDLNGFDQTISSISVAGTDATQNIITNRSGTLATLTINGASSTSVTFSGNLAACRT